MNKLLHITFFISILISISTECLSQAFDKAQIRVIPKELEQKDDLLYINMDIDISSLVIDPDMSLTLTPILVAPNNDKELPEVKINGKRRSKDYKRKMSLMGKKKREALPVPYSVLKTNKKSEGIHNYSLTIPFEGWMREARLDLKENLCGCANASQELIVERLVNQVKIENIDPYIVQPIASYIRPEAEEIKNRSEQVDVFLDFPVNKTIILPEFGNNPKELPKIESAIKEIHTDKNVLVSQVEIIGYASPEGSVKANNALSEGRAESLRSYLARVASFPADIYKVMHGGEDWDGLIRIMEEANFENYSSVSQIIKDTYSVEERKAKIKALNGGRTYSVLLKDYYPSLRRVVCRINYTVRGFSVEEGKEIIKTRPQQLSLNEMFLIANSYPVGSDEFVEVFETAVRMFPQDKVANLNAAAAALIQKDLTKAERYLNATDKSAPEYINNLGLLYLLREDYDNARKFLSEAEKKGLKEAKHNLEELEKAHAQQLKIEKQKKL